MFSLLYFWPQGHVRLWTTLLAWLIAAPDVLFGAEPDLTLKRAVELALAGNPGLAEIKARAEALAAVPPQAGAPPDPMLNLGLLWLPTRSFDVRKDDFTMLEVGVSQTIPFPGKLGLKEKIAEQEALAAADSIEEARLRLVREVKLAWWRLFYFDHALNLTADAEHLLQRLVDIAQGQYQVGQGQQQNLLLSQLELAKLKDERLELISLRHAQATQLNTLLNLEPDSPVNLPPEAEFKLPAIAGAKLQEKARQTRPLFAQHQKMLEAAKRKVDLAKKEIYPDLTVSAAYDYRWDTPTGQSRSDYLSLGLSVNLPIHAGRNQLKAIDQRHSELLQERYALQDEHLKVHGEIAAKLAEYEHAKERVALLEREVIPQARQIVNSLLAGYPVGTASFSDLLRAETTLFRYQAQYWQTLTRAQQTLAELSAAVGEEVGHDD